MSSRTSDVGPRIFSILFALASLACLPSLVYGQLQKDSVKLFPREVHPGVDTLIPYFTSKTVVKREQLRLGNDAGSIELPQLGQPVELVYGEDRGNVPTSTDPFITTVQIVPASNRAILLLEEYLVRPAQDGGILQQVRCEGLSQEPGPGRVLLEMGEIGQGVETFNQWLTDFAGHEEKELVVVTSDMMKGCGFKERKAFLLNAVDIEGTTATLTVLPIEWSEVYVKMSVEFGRLSKSSLTKRFFDDVKDFFTSTVPDAVDKFLGDDDSATATPTGKPSSTPKDGDEDEDDDDDEDGINGQGQFDLSPDIKPRLQLFPITGIKPTINITLPFDIPFLPQEDGQNTENGPNPGLTVTCVNCTLTGTLAYQGKLDIDITGLESAFIELNVTQDLRAGLNLEFATGDKPFQFEFQQSIFPPMGSQDGIALPGFGILGILQIVPYFDYSIGASIEVGAPKTNVTVGGELRVPKGAWLRWDLVKDTSAQVGWDVDAISFPARINEVDTGNFSLGLNFSSIPSVLMNLEVGKALPGSTPIQVGAKLAMILPRLYTLSTLVHNVTELCAPPGPEDYTYFPTGIAFESGLYTALVGELYAQVDLPLGKGDVVLSPGVEFTHTIWEDTFPFKDACFLFGDSKTGLGELRNATLPDAAQDRVFDIKKIEDKFKQTGELPAGLDLEKLSKVEGLPDDLKAVLVVLNGPSNGKLSTEGQSSLDDENNGLMLRGSVWTVAIVAFGTAFF